MKNINKLKLIVGLSNPGKQYCNTRHNVGSWYVKNLAKYHLSTLKLNEKLLGFTGKIIINNKTIHLLIPNTYMNLNGHSVLQMINFYRLSPEEMLIAHDELDLNAGSIRFKIGGSTNGHNGLNNIVKKIGYNKNFCRLRIGIGRPKNKTQIVKFVLGIPNIMEINKINQSIKKVIENTELFMNCFFDIKHINKIFNINDDC